MDTQQYTYKYEIEEQTKAAARQEKNALRYRRLKFFVDTLVIMDANKGAMHFTDGDDLDAYIDSLTIANKQLTAKDITAHALNILEDQFNMSSKENKV